MLPEAGSKARTAAAPPEIPHIAQGGGEGDTTIEREGLYNGDPKDRPQSVAQAGFAHSIATQGALRATETQGRS